VLLEKIDEVIETSEHLRDLFSKRVPDEPINSKSLVLATINKMFLKKYSKMRARDVLRRVRNSTRHNASESFTTHEHMLALSMPQQKKDE
jgi:hypothetical protein